MKLLKKSKNQLKSFYSGEIKAKTAIKKSFKKKDLRNFSIGRGLSIVQGPERAREERDQKIKEIDGKIELISKMPIKQYLNYLNEKNKKFENKNEDESSLSTISEEIEERLKKLEEIIKRNKNIKYNLKIKF